MAATPRPRNEEWTNDEWSWPATTGIVVLSEALFWWGETDMIRRLRTWAASRRAERRALAEYRCAWRRLARLRRSPAGPSQAGHVPTCER
jgi:hypothetical protein